MDAHNDNWVIQESYKEVEKPESQRDNCKIFLSIVAKVLLHIFRVNYYNKPVVYTEHHSNVERRKIDTQENSLVQNHLEMCGHRNPRFSESGFFYHPRFYSKLSLYLSDTVVWNTPLESFVFLFSYQFSPYPLNSEEWWWVQLGKRTSIL